MLKMQQSLDIDDVSQAFKNMGLKLIPAYMGLEIK